MDVATGCGFKEIYRFPHTIIIITHFKLTMYGTSYFKM